MKQIKYGIIQPLTGGWVFAAKNALGYPASWIISYPGLTDVKKNKKGEITHVGNEYGVLKWLKEHNELPPYQLFNKSMFQETDLDVNLIDDPVWSTTPVDYKDTDLVVSLPVCAGLSMASRGSAELKNEHNRNMLFNAEFTLGKIKPKIYIFENAPALFATDYANNVRAMLNDIANKYGYSIVYYKTDTKLHDNCQARPRTFVYFIKHRDGQSGTSDFLFENKQVGLAEFFARLPSGLSQSEPFEMAETDKLFLDYIIYKFGTDFRDKLGVWYINELIRKNLLDDLCDFILKSNYPKNVIDSLHHTIRHIQHKVSMGKNFYAKLIRGTTQDGTMAAVMYRTIPSMLHYKDNRLYSIREYLYLMGMPNDYELQGSIKDNYPKIGQNVPVRTAQWIISEAARIIENWDTIERHNPDVLFVDNIRQKALC